MVSIALRRREDPFLVFRFGLYIDGFLLARASSISGLGNITESEEVREGGSTRVKLLPKRTRSDPVTLSQGIIFTDNTFEEWRYQIASLANDGKAIPDTRKNAIITLLNKDNKESILYKLTGCWPSSIKRPDFDAFSSEIAFLQMILQVEGDEREGTNSPIVEPVPALRKLRVDF